MSLFVYVLVSLFPFLFPCLSSPLTVSTSLSLSPPIISLIHLVSLKGLSTLNQPLVLVSLRLSASCFTLVVSCLVCVMVRFVCLFCKLDHLQLCCLPHLPTFMSLSPAVLHHNLPHGCVFLCEFSFVVLLVECCDCFSLMQ